MSQIFHENKLLTGNFFGNWSKVYLIILCSLVISICSLAQNLFEIEKLFQESTDTDFQFDFEEYLLFLIENPLDINKASAQELGSLPWISPTMAAKIINYRHRVKHINELVELEPIVGENLYKNIVLFLSIKEANPSFKIKTEARERIIVKKEKSRGFRDSIFQGSCEKILNRLKCSLTRTISIGILTEKDPGESKLADHFMGNLNFNMKKYKTKICVGYFSLETGQGLVFGKPFKLPAGGEIIYSAKQKARGISPYLSTNENSGYCGVGLSTVVQNFSMAFCASKNFYDAHIVDSVVLSTPSTGLHRTLYELDNKNKLREKLCGFTLAYQYKTFKIEYAQQTGSFDAKFPKDNSSHLLKFHGDVNNVSGIYLEYANKYSYFFSEIAQSKSRGIAFLCAAGYDFETFETIMHVRHYAKDYYNFHSQAFGENTETRNEQGLYFGCRYRPSRKTVYSFYINQYKFPWKRYKIPMPSFGYETYFLARHTVNSQLAIQICVKSESKAKSINFEDTFQNTVVQIENFKKNSVKLEMEYEAIHNLKFKNRIVFSWYNEKFETDKKNKMATLLSQDVFWFYSKYFDLKTSVAFFDTPHYDLSLYQFENDVPGHIRIKMLNGRGCRFYVLARIHLFNKNKVSFKYEHTFFDDMTSIGSGYDCIDGQEENMCSVQLDWRL